MAIDNAQAVLDRMEADPAFAERVKAAGSPEASLALLHEEGFDVSTGDLRDATLDRYADELTPEQLDAVAGGIDIKDVASVMTGAAGGALVCVAIMGAIV